ncbi:hypothetical protein COBRASIX_15 [Enterobacter phage vB_EclS_CobraSix]|uniref:Uncharacterized protein n=1 Tax=Enterobacter phage vB_EclS_CobraSix TaxID=2894794 RepID=A0AAE9CBM6_9CAUD|nr:hypothetical protein PQD12_gp15 [Enterobacter phage vB_EclS_CobraSix]UGO47182.1 hypothetical protein COBRASIX_15 [Enterobacter phage vB_EclS_CobraSix]
MDQLDSYNSRCCNYRDFLQKHLRDVAMATRESEKLRSLRRPFFLPGENYGHQSEGHQPGEEAP